MPAAEGAVAQPTPRTLDPARLMAPAGAAIVAVYWVAEFLSHLRSNATTADFLEFYQAGRAVLNGADPYHVLAGFYNPPWVAVWMAPFGAMPPRLAETAWNLLGIAAVLACGFMCYRIIARRAGRAPSTTAVSAAVLAVMLFYPLRQNFDSVQSDVLPLVATFLCVVLDDAGHQFLAGVSLTPGLFDPHLILGPCVYLIARLRWRAVGGAIAGGLANAALAAVVLGPSSIVEFVRRLGAAEVRQAAHPFQVTIIHTLLSAGISAHLAYPAFAVVAASSVALAAAAMRRPGSLWRNLALCAVLTEMVIPFGFAYDFAPTLLALPWIVERLQGERFDGLAPVAVFGLSIYFGGVSWVRSPLSHDLLHAIVPLCLLPALWAWRTDMRMERRPVALALALWAASDVLFGLGNAICPLWVDSLAFNLGAATVLAAGVIPLTTANMSAGWTKRPPPLGRA